MKKNILGISCLVVFTSFLLSFSMYDSEKETPYLVKEFNASQIKSLNIETSGGGITVEGGNESKAKVEVYIKGSNWKSNLSKEDIASKLSEYDFSVDLASGTLSCIAKRKEHKNDWKNGLSISFKVFVPTKINTDLHTSGGGIDLKSLKGDLQFHTSGGGLNLTGISGNVKGRTSGGGITMYDCHEILDLHTSGGGISVDKASGTLSLKTSGGGLNLSNISGNINAKTSGGGIDARDIKGELITSTTGGSIHLEGIAGNVEARTSGGNIHADVLSFNNFLTLSTSGGNIVVDMPLNKGMDLDISGENINTPAFTNFNGTKSKKVLGGTINGGGAKVQLSANSGNVTIK